MRTWDLTGGRGPTGRSPKHWRTSAVIARVCVWVNWRDTGLPLSPSTWPRPSGTPARQVIPRSVRWPLPTLFATTPKPSTSTPRSPTPIQSWGSIWRSGSAPPNARPGTRAYRVTLLTAARLAVDLGDTDRLVAAALANNRGYTSNNNATDTDKVDVLEMALDRLSADDPDRALVLATLCSEIVIRKPNGTTSGVGRRGIGHRRVLG